MSLYRSLFFPLLRCLDPETAHDLAIAGLERAQSSALGCAILRRIAGPIPQDPVEIAGLQFPNRIGLAAGFDKNWRGVEALALLGFGHIEVGTLTPRPQPGNPRPRIFRLPAHRAVINRMGFPNCGLDVALARADAATPNEFGRPHLLGVSIGKQKDTPLERAVDDYLAGLRGAEPFADYIAINISSPNTPELRKLQTTEYLRHLCSSLRAEAARLADAARAAGEQDLSPPRPIFVKIAPDLADAELDDLLGVLVETGIEAVIATNTTLGRPAPLASDPRAAETGGLSGAPLRDASTLMIREIARRTSGRLPIIGVGGIDSPEAAREKLDAGATLLQLYTGLIYEGPGLPGRILRGLR